MSEFILLNELGKRDKMRSLSSILSLFPNEFSESFYHITLKLLKNCIFGIKTSIYNATIMSKPLVFNRFYCMT